MTSTTHSTSRPYRRLAVAVLAALTLPLAGCGDDVDPVAEPTAPGASGAVLPEAQAAENAAAQPKADPATVAWAGQLCGVVARNTSNVEPPAIDPADPAKTVKSFVWMFGRMEALMGQQRAGLASISAPPDALREPYAEALDRFDQARDLVGDAQKRLSKVSPDSPQELVEALKSVGDLRVGDKVYPGLVADLATLAPSFSGAVREAKACSAVPGV